MTLRVDVFQQDPNKAINPNQDEATYYDALLRKVALILDPLRLEIEAEERTSNAERVFTMIDTLQFGEIVPIPVGYSADLKTKMQALIDREDFVAIEKELRQLVIIRNN